MSYTPTKWVTGDIVTSEKLNKLENGLASVDAGASIVFATLDISTQALNKTWQEIADADVAYIVLANASRTMKMPVVDCLAESNNLHYVAALGVAKVTGENDEVTFESMLFTFVASSADDYPTLVLAPA